MLNDKKHKNGYSISFIIAKQSILVWVSYNLLLDIILRHLSSFPYYFFHGTNTQHHWCEASAPMVLRVNTNGADY